MVTIENEIARAKNLNHATIVKAGFSKITPRSTELNAIKDGDVITIPADYVALEQPIRNSNQKAYYCFVNCKRDGEDRVVAFYPTSFWKRRQTAVAAPDPDDETKTIYVGSGEYVASSGEVASLVQSFASLDEAMKEIADKPIQVSVTKVDTLPYGEDKVDSPNHENIYTFEWAA